MLWMNESEIDRAVARHKSRPHAVLTRASKALSDFRDIVNANSDGWPYWQKAAHAARGLMEVVSNPEKSHARDFSKAMVSIRRFCARHKLQAPEVVPDGQNPYAEKPVPDKPDDHRCRVVMLMALKYALANCDDLNQAFANDLSDSGIIVDGIAGDELTEDELEQCVELTRTAILG